jgi:hypothetical protein
MLQVDGLLDAVEACMWQCIKSVGPQAVKSEMCMVRSCHPCTCRESSMQEAAPEWRALVCVIRGTALAPRVPLCPREPVSTLLATLCVSLRVSSSWRASPAGCACAESFAMPCTRALTQLVIHSVLQLCAALLLPSPGCSIGGRCQQCRLSCAPPLCWPHVQAAAGASDARSARAEWRSAENRSL